MLVDKLRVFFLFFNKLLIHISHLLNYHIFTYFILHCDEVFFFFLSKTLLLLIWISIWQEGWRKWYGVFHSSFGTLRVTGTRTEILIFKSSPLSIVQAPLSSSFSLCVQLLNDHRPHLSVPGRISIRPLNYFRNSQLAPSLKLHGFKVWKLGWLRITWNLSNPILWYSAQKNHWNRNTPLDFHLQHSRHLPFRRSNFPTTTTLHPYFPFKRFPSPSTLIDRLENSISLPYQ